MKQAADGLKLQFLVLESSITSTFKIGQLNVSVCKPTIQCINADALIIAVNSDLYMNNSGVGSLFEAEGRPTALFDHSKSNFLFWLPQREMK